MCRGNSEKASLFRHQRNRTSRIIRRKSRRQVANSLIPFEAAFLADSCAAGNTFVAKIHRAFRPLSKDWMINHSGRVSVLLLRLQRGTHAYFTADGNSSTSKIAVKARRAIELLGLCRSMLFLFEFLSHWFRFR